MRDDQPFGYVVEGDGRFVTPLTGGQISILLTFALFIIVLVGTAWILYALLGNLGILLVKAFCFFWAWNKLS